MPPTAPAPTAVAAPTSAALAGQLTAYNANPVTSTDALNGALAQYGVPEIRNTVSGLRTTVANTTNALNNVDPSVTGRTQGSLVTEAQRQRQVANESAPIAAQLKTQTDALNTNQTDLTDALNQATQTATAKVNDYNSGRQAVVDQYGIAYKSEQDAAAAAQAQSNADRTYALQARAANTKAAPTSADILTAVRGHVADQLESNKGKDNKVSNETWAAALNDFTTAGGTTRQFWQDYGQYVNGKYPTSYAGYAAR